MIPIFVGYFTYGTAYQYEAAQCIQTLDAHGLEHEFMAVSAKGTWARNCAMKPGAILYLMEKHDGRPIVYLDSDSRVRQRPVLFNTLADYDVAVHYRDGHELLSSVIYFGPTKAARNVLLAWDAECLKFLKSGSKDHCLFEQLALQRVLDTGIAKVHRLPAEYARIFDDPKMGDAVIEQQQASRRLADGVKT